MRTKEILHFMPSLIRKFPPLHQASKAPWSSIINLEGTASIFQITTPQCKNLTIFLPLRFYVKHFYFFIVRFRLLFHALKVFFTSFQRFFDETCIGKKQVFSSDQSIVSHLEPFRRTDLFWRHRIKSFFLLHWKPVFSVAFTKLPQWTSIYDYGLIDAFDLSDKFDANVF